MLCICQAGLGCSQLWCSSRSRHGFAEPSGCLALKSTFRWALAKLPGSVFVSLSLSDVLCPFSWLGLQCSQIKCFCIFGAELIISPYVWGSHRELRPARALLVSSTPRGLPCGANKPELILGANVGSAGPVSPGTCAKRLLRLQRCITVEPSRVWEGLWIWAQSCTKTAPAVPGEELAPEARALHPCDAAFSSSPGAELFLFVWHG